MRAQPILQRMASRINSAACAKLKSSASIGGNESGLSPLCLSAFQLFGFFPLHPSARRQTDDLPGNEIAGQKIRIQPQNLLDICSVSLSNFIECVALLKPIDRSAVFAQPPVAARRHAKHIARAKCC